MVIERIAVPGYEEVVRCVDAGTGLRAIVAIHSTALGPALGGVRFRPYGDDEEALHDVLRLARGMTYKAAVAGLDLGGGKAVLVGDPARLRSDELLRAYARFVDSLGGRYLTAEDVGTTQTDMDLIRQETRHVTGGSESAGGSGDPSPATALGVVHALRALAEHAWGDDSLEQRHVVVVGAGKVGSALIGHLVTAGAVVSVADVDPARVDEMARRHGARPVDVDEALTLECDVLAPCALGGILDADTIPRLRCRAVCGPANNQLAKRGDADRLARARILYVPDYVASAGGIINIAEELRGYDGERAVAAVAGIRRTAGAVLAAAATEGVTPLEAADRIAERRLASATHTGGRRAAGS
ncbi:MAG TPA: Glu/Leu/Phe/Val dehydrogenase dimerization domain-containing protein [Acidimicrobiales bacterium]|nr:Glu/Leu/Phe/Val dehydrogenase dimerization domain-containing protein [Acidimicrobiales bacterium]